MNDSIHKRIRSRLIDLDIRNIVVAVSGGSDSVCLLHSLTQLRQELSLNITAAHLDHMIRGQESCADANAVIELCKVLGVPCESAQIDVPEYKKEHSISSMEDAARMVRYNVLKEVADRHDAVVATGHNADDNVETILMHIIRGCGPAGLTGLKTKSSVPTSSGHVIVIRPLLKVSKSEINAYCQEWNLPVRQDSTNNDIEYTRNRIRKELIPLLETYNPNIKDSLLRLAESAGEQQSFIEERSKKLDLMLEETDDGILIDRDRFGQLQDFEKKQLLTKAIDNLLGHHQDIEKKHLDDMVELEKGGSGRKIDLPNGLEWWIEYKTLRLSKQADTETFSVFSSTPLTLAGRTVYPGGIIDAQVCDFRDIEISEDNDHAYIDASLLSNPYVRSRLPGDAFTPFGSGSKIKVARFLMNRHVSKSDREQTFLLCDGDDIVWVIGHRIDDRFKVTDETASVLCLHVRY